MGAPGAGPPAVGCPSRSVNRSPRCPLRGAGPSAEGPAECRRRRVGASPGPCRAGCRRARRSRARGGPVTGTRTAPARVAEPGRTARMVRRPAPVRGAVSRSLRRRRPIRAPRRRVHVRRVWRVWTGRQYVDVCPCRHWNRHRPSLCRPKSVVRRPAPVNRRVSSARHLVRTCRRSARQAAGASGVRLTGAAGKVRRRARRGPGPGSCPGSRPGLPGWSPTTVSRHRPAGSEQSARRAAGPAWAPRGLSGPGLERRSWPAVPGGQAGLRRAGRAGTCRPSAAARRRAPPGWAGPRGGGRPPDGRGLPGRPVPAGPRPPTWRYVDRRAAGRARSGYGPAASSRPAGVPGAVPRSAGVPAGESRPGRARRAVVAGTTRRRRPGRAGSPLLPESRTAGPRVASSMTSPRLAPMATDPARVAPARQNDIGATGAASPGPPETIMRIVERTGAGSAVGAAQASRRGAQHHVSPHHVTPLRPGGPHVPRRPLRPARPRRGAGPPARPERAPAGPRRSPSARAAGGR